MALVTGAVMDSIRGTGYLYIHDCRIAPRQISQVYTGQHDIHAVRFSPCGTHIFTTEVSDSSIQVYDARYLTENHFLLHKSFASGNPMQDESIAATWFPVLGKNMVACGGGNGMIDIWDVSKDATSDGIIQSIPVGHATNNICISEGIPSYDCNLIIVDTLMMWAGTESGSVHVFHQNFGVSRAFTDNLM
jgi:WD40 repeat protein